MVLGGIVASGFTYSLPQFTQFVCRGARPLSTPTKTQSHHTATIMSSPITGSCLCKRIQYTLTGTDKGPVLCHCSNCQKTTGSAFANNHRFTRAEINFSAGSNVPKSYKDSNTISGNTLTRFFCGDCGSPIYLTNEKFKGLVILYSGALDDNGVKSVSPKGELFTHNRRGWFPGVEGAAKL
jgi:hypothetical protein